VLLGRGSINGAEVNRYEVDGGGYIFDLDGVIMAVDTDVVGGVARRLDQPGRAEVSINGIGSFRPPYQIGGGMEVRIDPLLGAVRAYPIGGDMPITIAPRLVFNRKASIISTARVDVATTGLFDRAFFSSWDWRRKMYVDAETRRLYVEPEPRDYLVAPDADAFAKQKDDVIQ
jgi:hypothetical protein